MSDDPNFIETETRDSGFKPVTYTTVAVFSFHPFLCQITQSCAPLIKDPSRHHFTPPSLDVSFYQGITRYLFSHS
jgi:hypothetical protein